MIATGPGKPTTVSDSVLVRGVWLAEDADIRTLSVGERERYAALPAGARRRFAGVRSALRHWLAELTGEEPSELAITVDSSGKPRLAGSDLRFSVSHSHELGAIAVARGRDVGIDVERVTERPRLGAIARRVAGDAEAKRIARSGDPLRGFYEAWTRHEALAKALGTGLPLPDASASGFSVENIALADGYAAGLALADARPGARPCPGPFVRKRTRADCAQGVSPDAAASTR